MFEKMESMELLPSLEEIFLLLFSDDIVLVSSTPSGLQNQINNLEKASNSLGLTESGQNEGDDLYLEKEDILVQGKVFFLMEIKWR